MSAQETEVFEAKGVLLKTLSYSVVALAIFFGVVGAAASQLTAG